MKGAIEGPFQDPPVHTLYLVVHIPPSSGFLVYYERSPWIILGCYTGDGGEIEVPNWVNAISSVRSFWQPRAHMLEIVAKIAMDENNAHVMSKLLRWCEHNSVRIMFYFLPNLLLNS